MGRQLNLLLMQMFFILGVLPFHGSADHAVSPNSPLSFGWKEYTTLVAPPPGKVSHHLLPTRHAPAKATHPHHSVRPSSIALPPSIPSSGGPAKKWVHAPEHSPSSSRHKNHLTNKKFHSSAPEPTYSIHSHTNSRQGPSVSPFRSPSPSSKSWTAPAPAPTTSEGHYNMPIFPPAISPIDSSLKRTKSPPPSPILALPPPPPNEDCSSITCTDPLTYTPPGSTCGCVQPIEVKLQLDVAIYTFFPSVSKLAEEIADSVALNHSQVRIMGADASSQQLEKTRVLVNLVPTGLTFDGTTAFQIYEKFWRRQISINASLFGDYEVLNVHYPGLPPSPPSAPSAISTIDDGPYTGQDNNGRVIKPIGVDVPRKRNDGIKGSMIAVIVLSAFTAFLLCVGFVWLLLLKCRSHSHKPEQYPQPLTSSPSKFTGPPRSVMFGSTHGSGSMSLSSGTINYTGSAKTFTLHDMERATNNFDASRILGEGGFGLVYSATLDDGREVAVKVLKRDDHHGGREFLAEVEMLGRLHHRNLVKLIGICTEGHTRCLVYELVPNGSVESHLHGVDKETDPLDWDARIKIALGAARGLAYLHEDSNPRVIHRDFKASNILLEYDFTPKVSDFGLARAALEEGKRHISTHVMGTFGYLAPEYAMTGHLLVKSDVYSYGVVLLELLTGRKPVDLSQPAGQENLVAWARPLLTSKEGLESIIDPVLKSDMITWDSVTKVAAIASMCIQPEVSHRPFMGEVVQALKLVCNEFKETNELGGSTCFGQDDDDDICIHTDSGNLGVAESELQMPVFGDSHDSKIPSTSDLLSANVGFEVEGQEIGSFRRYSSSGPLRTGRRRQFWQRLRSLSRGSLSEHGLPSKLWPN
ncbi:PREDICTED: receptor-like serine/threonine-protein kinase ALE2 isoform X1 [Fragaria vesca subsp. vesca]|uniref:receptor-like serine/threonine-protein kinase ALE2 isoform X1 n=1 Tax=Fragaria vesca subsp. vesca TaxID=101020 RepID=UPI0002C2DD66|nr:PREDICTED: receptor-like serine/threonine-protein kinase ALE2 isoform X1 [Fragaria vesca subsp. vesca]XP_011463321.1 PREDICTED: receptor-like serine/threonine-protein kinase ALE2 isoform X1 [Fragaria vesca subsp. vesca]